MPDVNQSVTCEAQELNSLAQRTAVVCAVVSLFGFAVWGLVFGADVLLVIFAGFLFAVFLRALSEVVERYTGLGKTWSLVVVVLGLTVLAVASGWFLVPKLVSQIQDLRHQLPESLSKLRKQFGDSDLGEWVLQREPFFEKMVPEPSSIMSGTTGALSSAIGTAGIALMIFYTGLMLAAQREIYIQGMLQFLPSSKREQADHVFTAMGRTLKWWLAAKVVSMIFVGVATWLGLIVLNIQLAVSLSALAAVLTFIPNFGPIISATPAVLLGLMQSPMTAVWVIVLFIVVQLLESYIVTPAIQYRALSMPPVLVVAAQLMGGVWFGILGLALATPLLAAAMVLVQELYLRKHQQASYESGQLQLFD